MKQSKYKELMDALDNISNKQKAEIYKSKYLKNKKVLDDIKKEVGL